jgi:hypothetical protein
VGARFALSTGYSPLRHGRWEKLYEGSAVCLMIAALASILFECGYRIVRRWRQG